MITKQKNNYPKISIVIPSYNKVEYIEETLQSIVEQNYPNLEVIIQDGGSKDGSVDIIRKFANKNPKLFIWESKKDKGQVDAINKGIKKATGDIITYINADDVYKKNALIKIGKCFSKNKDCLWVTGYGDIIDSKGRQTSILITKYKNLFINFNLYTLLLVLNYVTQPSTFWRKSVHSKIGFLTGTKRYVMEYEFWLKLFKIKKPDIVKDYIASFRLTTDNISATSFDELLGIDNDIAAKFTNNKLLLVIHKFHNFLRKIIIKILISYEKVLAQ